MAAGKALGESNKRAREALKREIGSRAGQSLAQRMEAWKPSRWRKRLVKASAEAQQGAWIPSLDLPTVISIVGIGITIFQMYRAAKSEHVDPSQARGPCSDTADSLPTPNRRQG